MFSGVAVIVLAMLPAVQDGWEHRHASQTTRRTAEGASLMVAGPLDVQPGSEVIADIRVHGNVATGDDEIRKLAGIEVGAPFGPEVIEQVAERLRRSGRFERVEVLKRYASIADPTQIVLVIVVDEGAVAIERTGDPLRPTHAVKTHRPDLMVLPLVTAEDGYGVTYGAQLAVPHPIGAGSRVSFPLTWGGDKRAAVELEKDSEGERTRLSAGVAINRRTHPFFDRDEDRFRVWTRAERQLVTALRVGATAGWQHISFAGDAALADPRLRDERFEHVGVDAVIDTRRDPLLARNAIYARGAWEHLWFGSATGNNRTELEARGYIGLVGQTIVMLRAIRQDATAPLPVALQPMLGGLPNVRGFRVGAGIGDTLTAGTVELRQPLTSPLKIAKLGVSAFFDVGDVHDGGQRLGDRPLKKGAGAGIWASAAFLRINLAVAHGIGAGTRVHFGGTLSF